MNLLVIESSGKEGTIKKYLGREWEVFATKGHIRDLPVKTIGVDVNNNFEPKYEIMKDKETIVKRLKEKAKKADKVYLATDPDREGEAISWHIANILEFKPEQKCRVVFNEITKDVVLDSLNFPHEIDIDTVYAQQARRVLDRLVGYKISPILCKKLDSNLSAGRVQSVALKLVVDREREILDFKPQEYWTVQANLEKLNTVPDFKALLISHKGKKLKINNQEETNRIISEVKTGTFEVKSVKKSIAKSHAPAPFTTSTMQQDALNKLGMSLKKATSCAQELYEGVQLGEEGKIALVTYIRTDSVRVSEEAIFKARKFITEKYGSEYIPEKSNHYKSRSSAQDAHEAIRPVNLERTPESIRAYVSTENYKLYKLIYERFLSSQMSEATFFSVVCEIKNGEYIFKVNGKTPKFLGFTVLYYEHKEKDSDEEKEDKEVKLPELKEGDLLSLIKLLPEQKFTKPAPRYSEATLINAMEQNGIGRPATYAPTILILSSRKYVEREGKQLKPTELGFTVTDILQKYFNNIINVDFTAHMETRLDEIAEGSKVWQNVVSAFYAEFLPQLRLANMGKEDGKKQPPVVSDVQCSKCGALMVFKEGRYGKFLACPNYPVCKNIQGLGTTTNKIVGKCPVCDKNLYLKKSKKGTVYYACEDYTNCKFMSWNLPLKDKCPKCNSYLTEKNAKDGKYINCSNAQCGYSVKKASSDNTDKKAGEDGDNEE